MAIFSSVRSQRGANRNTEATEQLIAFRLREEWFALPVSAVQKVIPLGTLHGDPNHTGIGLTLHQGQEITVVDVGHRIFNEAALSSAAKALEAPSPLEADNAQVSQRCLVIVKTGEEGVVGVPIDSQPTIRRAGKSQFAPLPSSYLSRGNIHCVSSMIVDDGGVEPLFLIDPEQLASV
ncbi:chemotaxis protein CheW [Acaryochloris sp. CCMEE 5410]|uniref:chemotaxis protein CheW n=1 Tax=Acaryochloris sp. CCMEE 5410 TaxID=310037 RepID=UPI0002484811|nr:chemotaxis protein CheW [Acaryochloris sp. CCMEE 5410]KAI9131079.1 chemotaxis protein CheW [Acaryochloris sp. CCMEE 5410]